MGAEQFSLSSTFAGALKILFDVSNAGNSPGGKKIVDANGKEVFSLLDPEDIALLKSLDREGGHWLVDKR